MALWHTLSDESQRAPESLDMLLFLKRNPHMSAEWTQLLDDIDRKCTELQVPVERFYKRTRAPRKVDEESRKPSTSSSNDTDNMNDSDDPKPSAAANDKSSVDMAGSSGTAVAPRMDWNELCFFLAMQLEIAMTTSSAATSSFPTPLSRNLRQLWPKKKVKRVADVVARYYSIRESDASRCVCAYDGIGELKNGQVKWVFLCDAFLSSLAAMQREQATQSAAPGGNGVVDTRDTADEIVTQDAVSTRSVVDGASAMVSSDNASSKSELGATDAALVLTPADLEKQERDQSAQQSVVAQSAEA